VKTALSSGTTARVGWGEHHPPVRGENQER
jgi:hypothetical protein